VVDIETKDEGGRMKDAKGGKRRAAVHPSSFCLHPLVAAR